MKKLKRKDLPVRMLYIKNRKFMTEIELLQLLTEQNENECLEFKEAKSTFSVLGSWEQKNASMDIVSL